MTQDEAERIAADFNDRFGHLGLVARPLRSGSVDFLVQHFGWTRDEGFFCFSVAHADDYPGCIDEWDPEDDYDREFMRRIDEDRSNVEALIAEAQAIVEEEGV